MGARTKLNVAFFNGSLILAGLIGLLGQSWTVFVIALIVLLLLQCHSGGIRLSRRGRRR